MTILDGHIHIMSTEIDTAGLSGAMGTAGVDGGSIISFPPASFRDSEVLATWRARLDNLFAWTAGSPLLFPFFWIDPTEADALDQVNAAAENGVSGFKVICTHFPPSDERALPVYRAIAGKGKPVMFHSGILWDGKDSSRFNRPAGFECLIGIEGLRFSLAHISWPWCDELIAVYGKFHNAHTKWSDGAAELFVDLTPGTPPIYRREALSRLFTVGYPVTENTFFGADNEAAGYDSRWAREWIDRDSAIYKEIGLSEKTVQRVFSENLERFITGNVRA